MVIGLGSKGYQGLSPGSDKVDPLTLTSPRAVVKLYRRLSEGPRRLSKGLVVGALGACICPAAGARCRPFCELITIPGKLTRTHNDYELANAFMTVDA